MTWKVTTGYWLGSSDWMPLSRTPSMTYPLQSRPSREGWGTSFRFSHFFTNTLRNSDRWWRLRIRVFPFTAKFEVRIECRVSTNRFTARRLNGNSSNGSGWKELFSNFQEPWLIWLNLTWCRATWLVWDEPSPYSSYCGFQSFRHLLLVSRLEKGN